MRLRARSNRAITPALPSDDSFRLTATAWVGTAIPKPSPTDASCVGDFFLNPALAMRRASSRASTTMTAMRLTTSRVIQASFRGKSSHRASQTTSTCSANCSDLVMARWCGPNAASAYSRIECLDMRELNPSLSRARLRLRLVSGRRCSSVDSGGGKDLGREWDKRAESAMDPQPPEAQMMRRKWDIRRANPVCRNAKSPSPVPILLGYEAEGAEKDRVPDTAWGEGERIVGG